MPEPIKTSGNARGRLPTAPAVEEIHSANASPARPCFHCGLPCAETIARGEGKVFCCQGCATVHDLLEGAGLSHFYELNRHPGVRMDKAAAISRWTYLDEPTVRQCMLDFADGNTCRVTFQIPSIHCVACVWLLENLFRMRNGIGTSRVNFSRREVSITFYSALISLAELAAFLSSIGYEPQLTLQELEPRGADPGRQRRWLQLGIAGFCFGNIMLFSIPGYLGLDSLSGPLFRAVFGYLSLALALPVVCFSAADYWRAAWLAGRQRALTLDLPIALGLAALYLQSAAEILTGQGGGYLDSLAGLVFFLLCGRAFQQKTFARMSFDRDYKCFFPLSVIRKARHGAEESVAISEIKPGDRLVLRHGELIPADCRLIAGEARVDYSFVTGEARPVSRAAGDYLYAGGKQAGAGIEVEILKPVSQSYLTSLWAEEAFRKERHDPLETLTNRYSRRFTKLVVAIALGAGLLWAGLGQGARGLKAFTSVLIVACPCALALAAPFALGAAQRLLARRRIFLKDALVLEQLARVDTIVFDKTGTLTATRSSAVEWLATGAPLSADEQVALASLARQSTHPQAQALSEMLPKDRLEPVSDFIEKAGAGVSGNVAGKTILLGSDSWLKEGGARLSEAAGQTSAGTGVAIDGLCRGRFVAASPVRPGVARMMAALGQRYELALLSGDNDREREIFNSLLEPGARLLFKQTPQDKLAFIRSEQAAGRMVMMVGDGLNDAGALRQSDVGVAVVERIGRFSPASDVILDADSVEHLTRVLELARRAVRVVRVSFGLSALYNLAGISIAACGLLSPLICAVLMPLSSISVVLFACGAVALNAKKLLGPEPPVSRASAPLNAATLALDPELSAA